MISVKKSRHSSLPYKFLTPCIDMFIAAIPKNFGLGSLVIQGSGFDGGEKNSC